MPQPDPRRVAARWLREAATAPLPKLTRNEPGLMTLDEYIKHLNPGGKHHSSGTYDFNLKDLNRDYKSRHVATLGAGSFGADRLDFYRTPKGYLVRDEGTGELVALIPNQSGTLYYDSDRTPLRIPDRFIEGMGMPYREQQRKEIALNIRGKKKVKYLDEYLQLVSSPAADNLARYPVVLQRLSLKGEPYTLRAEAPPRPGKGDTLAILNDEGLVVAQASNEWGATLLSVAKEYRGRGLGRVLGTYWYKINPGFQSGGFTPQGEKAAARRWAARVRQLLANGWYTELLKNGAPNLTISKDQLRGRIKRILADLPGRRPSVESLLPSAPEEPQKKQLLIYADYPTFVLYDARFLDDPEDEDAEDYIHGYGFFRDSPHVGDFLFTIDYDRPYQKATTLAALQMARNEGHPIYIGKGYGDLVEWDNLPGVTQDGDYIRMTQDALPLDTLAAKERLVRRKTDPYGEKEIHLLETAEAKWR